MSNREAIRAAVPLAAPRRADTADRAAALIEDRPHTSRGTAGGTSKLTTRVPADQLD